MSEVRDAVCTDCGGSGWVEVEGPDERVRRCPCRQRADLDKLLREASIPPRYAHCTLEGFRCNHHSAAARDQLRGAKKRCELFVEMFLDAPSGLRFRDVWLLLTGPYGVGKTHLAVGVLRALISQYSARGRFVEIPELAKLLQASLDRTVEESVSALLAPLERAEVLVLDELGSQKLNAWAADIVWDLINSRYKRRQPTILTSNFAFDSGPQIDEIGDAARSGKTRSSLGSQVPRRIISRLHELAEPVELDAVSDYRVENLAPRHRSDLDRP